MQLDIVHADIRLRYTISKALALRECLFGGDMQLSHHGKQYDNGLNLWSRNGTVAVHVRVP